MKINVIFLFTTFLCCSCVYKQKSNIESVSALYFNYSFLSIAQVNCDEIVKDIPKTDTVFFDDSCYMINYIGVLDTIITDPTILIDIERELMLLEPNLENDNGIDARIAVTIRYKNGKEDKLCIGGYFASVISYNGKKQLTNNKLLYLIKNNIGYYKWMTRDDMLYMDELIDTTFVRKYTESIEDNPLMN